MSQMEERSRQNLDALRVWAADPFILPKYPAAKGEPMTEERSRSNEETPKWVQTVALVRGELMTRFSDRLSMEEIASCAYAVAMRDGQGGTGMVEEERSQLEAALSKIATIALRGLPAKTGYMFYADEVRLVLQELLRAALEDRQEAAPETWQTATGYPDGTLKITPGRIPGVPSEAAPSKENAPLPDHLFGSCRNSRDPELCAGCERIQNTAAPVPEVQGTPTKYPFPKNPCGKAIYGGPTVHHCWLEVDHEGECKWIPASQIIPPAPVGTPQKETPPTFEQTPEEQHEADVQDVTYNNGDSYVAEGVQGKKPQTFEEWWVRGGRSAWFAAPHAEEIANVAFRAGEVSGEAAGRRSAITEITDLLDALKLLIRALGGLDHTSGSVHLAVLNGEKVLAKCAELLEKP